MRPFSLLLAVPLLLASSSALAADTDEPEGYEYRFEDDLLEANPNAAQGSIIRLRTQVVRRTLIRPRAHFVPQMLESVEQL